ncbi:MAG TPA: polyprenyl synthetase family protein [Candidatus Baltobacteraceae bacterium]|jgi:geranylgeranyl diphosphate synthase type I
MLSYHFGYGVHGPVRRGKRLRPQLLIRTALAEGAALEDALDAAAAIETLHNYSLVHDDIEDGDELRHGRRTLWAVYGIPQAVNAGDAFCALAFLTLMRAASRHDCDRVLRLVQSLHEAQATMCRGQALDLAFESADMVEKATYFEMIGDKTAALFSAACEMGALCAPCDDATVERYAELGRAYGVAFQIRDDVHGIWASTDATGKTAANDIARRKWTFPVVWALAGPPSAARAVIAKAYQHGEPLAASFVTKVVAALDSLGAREAANRAVEEHLAIVERYAVTSVRDFLMNSLELE